MLPKVATNLWHFSAARVAAATQQTVVTPTFRTVLQQKAQAAQASAQQATSVGWNASANAAGASGATSNAASAKFNAGGRFYNAYQQAAQDPSFAATQQDDDERKKNHNKRLSKRPIRPLQIPRRQVANPALAISPATKLAQARLIQTQAYYRSQQPVPTPTTSSLRVKNVEESPGTSSQNTVILSPKRHFQQRNYATASSGSSAPGPAPPVPEPKDPAALSVDTDGVTTGDLSAESQPAEESALEMTSVEETVEESERLLSQNYSSGTEEAAAEEVDDAFPELLHDQGETAVLSEGFVPLENNDMPSVPADSSRSDHPSDPWVKSLPPNLRNRHPSLHAIIRLARERPNAVPIATSLHGPIHSIMTDGTARNIRKDYERRRKELATHIAQLREDGVRDSLTWSYALWATIMLRVPGEPLRDAIALYNDLLSGTFVRAKPQRNRNPAPLSEGSSLEEPRKTWKDIEEDYLTSHARGTVIAPTEEVVALLIRSLAMRDGEVHSSLEALKHMSGMLTPLRHTSTKGTKTLNEEPASRDIVDHLAALEKENNFAPAMALVNATLQNRYPAKLGVVTYNLLLQSALNHAKLLAASEQEDVPSGVEVGGVPSAITIFAHLEKSGCRPSGRTFMLLLQIYSVAGDLDGAKEVWNEFRAACARGSIDWILRDDARPPAPTRKELQAKAQVPTVTPWSKKAGPVAPDQPLSKSAIRSMISVWTTMLRTYFVCGDAAGGLSLLEKMMDAPWRPLPTGRTGETLDDHAEAILTTVDVPPPAANTYYGVVKGFLDTGDTASAIQWFKRLLEQDVVHNMDTFGRKKTAWYMAYGGGKWEPTTHPPRPNIQLWDWMCQALYERGLVWELNDLMDFANNLIYQQTDSAVSKAMEELTPKKHAAMNEEERNRWTLNVIQIAVTQHDKRDHIHWNLVWRTNVSAMENPSMSLEDKTAHLGWLRTRVVDRIFFDRDVTSWSLTTNATETEADGERPTALPLLTPIKSIFERGGSVLRDRAWHAVGLYVSQGRIDEGIFLATKLFDLERAYILTAERESAKSEQSSASKKTREQEGGAGDKTLHSLADLRSLVAGLEERIWTYGSETKQYPSLQGLVAQLRLNSVAGVMPAMRSAWYSVNAFLAHREDPEMLTIFSDNSDWASLAQVFANTAMSVFYEENRPAPNSEMAWQLVTFLQVMQKNGKGFADIGRHNVYRLYKILEYHLGEEELSKLLISLGEGFSNPEQHFPAYVKKSGASSIPTGQTASSIKFLDVQASVEEARTRYAQASSIAEGPDAPAAAYDADENRAIPLRITPAQSTYIHEGAQRRTVSIPGHGEATVSPLVGFERLVAGFRIGDVPAPENIARLIVSLSHFKEKEKIIKCYEIGNEVLASLAVNKSWQASGWFALEDAMVTALAHCGDMKAASLHRSRMVAQGSAPSASSYGALIANIKDTTDNAAVAIELFEESRRLNVEPSAYLYNTIISRLAKARKADYAMMLFQAMKAAGLTPTEVTYGAIIAGCARIGDVHTAEVLFEEMRDLPGYQARIPPYNTMMQLYTHVRPNRERALYYYNLMEQMGVQPTPYTYKLLLDVYGKVQPVDIERMEEVIETMKSRGVELSGNHYSSVIVTRGCAMHDLDGALKVFDSLRSKKRQVASTSLWPMGRMMRGPAAPRTSLPDVLAYEALLTVLVTHHRIDLMQDYLDKMIQQDHVRPTAYINNLLIKGWASIGDITAAREVFESMLDPAAGAAAPNNHAPHVGINGVQLPNSSIIGGPNDPVYREPSSWEAMIRAELSVGDRDRATALLQRMKSRFYPAAVTAKIEGILWAPDIPASVTDTPDL